MDPISIAVIARAGLEAGGLAKAAFREGALPSGAALWRGVEESASFAASSRIDPVQLGRDVLEALERLGHEDSPSGETDDWGPPIGFSARGLSDVAYLASAVQGAVEQAGPLALPELPSAAEIPEVQAEAAPAAAAPEAFEATAVPEMAPVTEGAQEFPPTVELVNGEIPINARYAGQDVPLSEFPGIEPGSSFEGHSIHWSERGFPDFSPWVHTTADGKVCDVQIGPTGSRRGDAGAANAACGLERTPDGWCWHHGHGHRVGQTAATTTPASIVGGGERPLPRTADAPPPPRPIGARGAWSRPEIDASFNAGFSVVGRTLGHGRHHHEDSGRVQLVPVELHRAVPHTGGFAIWGREATPAMAATEVPSVERTSLMQRIMASFGFGDTR